MNKADLVLELEKALGNKRAAVAALDAVFGTIIRTVAQGEKVAITGFGTFERVDRAPRTGRNPKAGVKVRIPATKAPRFKPGTAFRAYVQEPSSLPATGSLISRSSASDS